MHRTINAKQRYNILHTFFYYFVRNIYFKTESAKTNSCPESLPVHEQSSSNIYQIVGLPLKKKKKVLCSSTRSHMQNATCHLLLHHPLCCIGEFLSHWKHLHPIQRLRDQPDVSVKQRWHSSQDKQVIFFSLQHFTMALFPTSVCLPAASDSVLKFEQKKSELKYYLILCIFRTRSIVILF